MTSPEPVWVTHARGRYPVEIDAGGLDGLADRVERLAPGCRVVVITDRNVARAVPISLEALSLVVAPGERSKTRARWKALTDRMLSLGYGRDTVVVALGGGVVGDLAGFVAATYLRGIPWIQAPTSLLAMVDASIGGKTGVNTRLGKNLVGAFHPPLAVLVDPSALGTLRSAHLRAGLVEAVKHGLVADAGYYDWIFAHGAELLERDPDALGVLVHRSVELKAAIVSADERETGIRSVLNAGHTVGHALEAATRYRLSHGEAVALGLVTESLVAERMGLAPRGQAAELAARFRRLGLRLALPRRPDDATIVETMERDKKRRRGEWRLALPHAPGELAGAAEATTAVSAHVVRQALGSVRRLLAG